MTGTAPRRVVHAIAEGVHLLDLAGPAQVLYELSAVGYPVEQSFVGDATTVVSAQGLPVALRDEWPSLGADDVIVVPGWSVNAPGAGAFASAALDRIASHAENGGWVVSVCAGADALGRAGVLNGRRCTTHHQLVDRLAQRYPLATVVPDTLYVADGRVWSSAGIASGIDLMLGLVAKWHGAAVAGQISRALVVFARRQGGDSQQSVFLRHRGHTDDAVHRAQEFIDEHYDEAIPLEMIARHVGVSPRTLTRHFVTATGLSPLAYQQAIRVEVAEMMVAEGATYERAAVAVGLSDARALRRLRAQIT